MPELNGQLVDIVSTYSLVEAQRENLLRVLRRPGFPLHPDAPQRAASLALGAFEASTEEARAYTYQILRAAASLEVLMAACYMFDHVADSQVSVADEVTEQEELALAIGMLTCAHAEMAQLVKSTETPNLNLRTVFTTFVSACAGQFLDAQLQTVADHDLRKSLEMTSLKAGNIGRLAAEVGAMISTTDESVIHLCSEFGFHLFTFAQLIDDIRDCWNSGESPSDLEMGKHTVPIAFLADRHASALVPGMPIHQTYEALKASGALSGAQLVAEWYLTGAKDCIAELETRHHGVSRFRTLVVSLENEARKTSVAFC